MKLALGTAQFGLAYGVANTAGQLGDDEAVAILQAASRAGIDTLDTAIAYGSSETRLGQFGVAQWKLVSKLPGLPGGIADVRAWVDEQVAGSLRRLQVDRLDALLLHRPADLLGEHGGRYGDALAGLRRAGLTRAVGYSVYSPAELDALWPVLRPDLVQAPFNVLDRRLLNSGWLRRLADNAVRVHTRSAFLQGLLLMPAGARPRWFEPWRPLLDAWLDWCAKRGCTPLQAALSYALHRPEIERVVVGVDGVAQLGQILQASTHAMDGPFPDIEAQDPELIEPSRWKL